MTLRHSKHRDKDPDSVRWFGIDWSKWLNGDTIQSATWTLDAGLTLADQEEPGGTQTKALISGGTVGQTLNATVRIVTFGGETEDCTLFLHIKEN